MKTLYNILIINCLLLLMFIMMASCSNTLTYQEALSKNERRIDDPEKLHDARFLVDAKSFNMLEMKLTENAVTSAYASAVVDLARQSLEDYKDMEDDLETIARKEKIALPTMMDDKHQAFQYEVVNSDREDFDKKFIEMMRKMNEENKEQYLNMATEAKDADIRAFAARKLDLLRAHATRMDEVEKKLMNTY
jgi:putative membrane protein